MARFFLAAFLGQSFRRLKKSKAVQLSSVDILLCHRASMFKHCQTNDKCLDISCRGGAAQQ